MSKIGIERKRSIIESAGQEEAMRQHAEWLSNDLVKKKPMGVKETLKTLLMSTRTILFRKDQIRKSIPDGQEDLEEIIKWIEADGL